jgi:EAL and modified HD-GYP domain-containing signal transduction protein
MLTAIIRAKMCEVLAAKVGIRMPERLFTVGLLSVLDAMLDSTMEDVLERLPLSEDVAHALLTQDNTLGKVLDFAISYEQGLWGERSELASTLNIDMPMAREAYLNALDWTTEITAEVKI